MEFHNYDNGDWVRVNGQTALIERVYKNDLGSNLDWVFDLHVYYFNFGHQRNEIEVRDSKCNGYPIKKWEPEAGDMICYKTGTDSFEVGKCKAYVNGHVYLTNGQIIDSEVDYIPYVGYKPVFKE